MTADWEEGFEHLEEYMAAHGDALVPAEHQSPDGFALGKWVQFQRDRQHKIDPVRRARLEALVGWIWDIQELEWESSFNYLEEFVAAFGDADVPFKHKTPDGFDLWKWVETERRKKNRLNADQIFRLESLRGWAWRANL